MDFKLLTSAFGGFLVASLMFIILMQKDQKTEINRILNEPLIVESVTRYVERIDDNTSEEVYIWTVCNVRCYELKRKHNIAIGVELEIKR